jgi:hypothetical protein
VGLSNVRRWLIAIALALAAGAAAPPSPASAGTRGVPNHRVRYGVSTNWSGYAVTGTGPYTSVSATWTQPAVECQDTPSGFSAFWAGLDGDTSRTVEQTGTEANCINGTASYAAWYEMYPKRPVNYPDTVRPGDSVTATVTSSGRGHFLLTLTDTTRGWSHTAAKRRGSARLASAEVIAEAPSSHRRVLPLADFGAIGFGNAFVNGSRLTASTPGIEPLTMASGAAVKAEPSSIGEGDFSDTWENE